MSTALYFMTGCIAHRSLDQSVLDCQSQKFQPPRLQMRLWGCGEGWEFVTAVLLVRARAETGAQDPNPTQLGQYSWSRYQPSSCRLEQGACPGSQEPRGERVDGHQQSQASARSGSQNHPGRGLPLGSRCWTSSQVATILRLSRRPWKIEPFMPAVSPQSGVSRGGRPLKDRVWVLP